MVNHHRYYFEVYAGFLRRRSFASYTQIRPVSHVMVHQSYQRTTMRNDLALLRLAEPLEYNRWVKPICLPAPSRTGVSEDWTAGPAKNTLCAVVGWGAMWEKGPESEQMRHVQLPIRAYCNSTTKDRHEICAGEAVGGRDACQGDSGGPLLCRSAHNEQEWYLAGVVSYGNGCARAGQYGAYTRVALNVDWITLVTSQPVAALSDFRPKAMCPGYRCMWGMKRCIPANKRCDHIVHCLGGEDEIGCIYNDIPNLLSGLNATETTVETTHIDAMTSDDSSTMTMFEKMETTSMSVEDSDETSQILMVTTTKTISSISEEPTTIETISSVPTTIKINSTISEKPTTTEKIVSPMSSVSTTTKTMSSMSEKPTTTIETEASVPTTTTQISSKSEKLTTTEKIVSTISSVPTTTKTISTISSIPTPTLIMTTTILTTTPTPLTTKNLVPETSLHKSSTNIPVSYLTTSTSSLPIAVEMLTNIDDDFSASSSYESTEKVTTTSVANMTKLEDSALRFPGKFICRNIPQIIELLNRCDRLSDCEDGTDELNCTCRDFMKGDLKSLICDGKVDCEDYSDEANCGHCQYHEFFCSLSQTCIPRRQRCNAQFDCAYQEDEQDCFALTNGQHLALDADKRPEFHAAGILSQNVQGVWRIVCLAPGTARAQKLAQQACLTLGLEGYSYFNLSRQHRLPHNVLTVHPGSMSQVIRLSSESSDEEEACTSLYVACKETSQAKQPLRVLRLDSENVFEVRSTSGTARRLKHEHKLHVAVEDLHWPWLAHIYDNGRLFCTAVLVNRHWLLAPVACYQNMSENGTYLTALFGGSKTAAHLHYSLNEQVIRIDCLNTLKHSELLLYHLEKPVQLTRYVLPTSLWQAKETLQANASCFALLRSALNGNMLNLNTKRLTNSSICGNDTQLLCYNLLDQQASFAKDQEVVSQVCANAANHIGLAAQLADQHVGLLVCSKGAEQAWRPVNAFHYNQSCNLQQVLQLQRLSDSFYADLNKIMKEGQCLLPHSAQNCSTHRCGLGACLQESQLCNGKFDCHDGSDEAADLCATVKRGEVCLPDEFKCGNSSKCVAKTKYCDHIVDCADLTDEPTICSCYTYLRATDPQKLCNGIRNCWDKSDESPALCNCTEQHFKCKTGECVPRDFVCDGEADCPAAEDEKYCLSIKAPLLSKIKEPLNSESNYRRAAAAAGLLIEQSFGVWHTKCFESIPNSLEVRKICKRLGFTTFRKPHYRVIDDQSVVYESEHVGSTHDWFSRSVFDMWTGLEQKYGLATKVVIASKFSPLKLHPELSIFLKSNKLIARVVPLNATEFHNCHRLELKC